jgi:arylsulfatase A-like enzyme
MHWDPIRGTGHGTHYAYDTHVPLVFWGGSWPAGSSEVETTPYDLAPTLAGWLGVTLPEATGRPLTAAGRQR